MPRAGVTALSAGLCGAAALQHLDLSGCNAGDVGAVALAAVLPGCALARLALARCGVGAAGGAALAAALAQNGAAPSLAELALGGNEALGDAAAVALAAALATPRDASPRLACLDVSECGVSAPGAAALVAAGAAASLRLFGNGAIGVADADGAALAAALAAAPASLTNLDVSGVRLAAAAGAALNAALSAGAAPGLATLEVGANPVRWRVAVEHLVCAVWHP